MVFAMVQRKALSPDDMSHLDKAHWRKVEECARDAVGRLFAAKLKANELSPWLDGSGPKHRFDLYAESTVIGGVTTSPLKNSSGSSNTGGRDRVCAELLWLSFGA